MSFHPEPLAQWAEQLSGSVRNKVLHMGPTFTVMLVAGANDRQDHHVNASEEFFYQIRGSLYLHWIDEEPDRAAMITVLREGEILVLPAGVPHRPVRLAGTLGLVIEETRREGVADELRWYCQRCLFLLHQTTFRCEHLEGSLMDALVCASSVRARLCPQCGHLNP